MSAANEALADGLYLHRRTEQWPSGTRTMTVTVDGEPREWVDADDFMAVQKERDDHRRVIALINAWRWSPAFVDRDSRRLDALLAAAGESVQSGRAMLEILSQFGPRGADEGRRA